MELQETIDCLNSSQNEYEFFTNYECKQLVRWLEELKRLRVDNENLIDGYIRLNNLYNESKRKK